MPVGLIQDDYYQSTTFSLEGVNLKACVNNLTYNMNVEMKYVNTSSEVVEGKYVFPIGDVAIYYFRAKIEDREVISQCRPRAEANATYDEAIEEGHSAFISEQDEECEDMFQIKIGNVPAKAPVVIELKYVGHLEAENVKDDNGIHGQVTMTLPQVLNPRYSPSAEVERENEAFENAVTVHKYKTTLRATLSMPHEIAGVYSPKDKFTVHFTSEDHRFGEVTLSEEFVADHDLQLCINLTNELSSCVAIGKGSKSKTGIFTIPCLMIQYMPDFTAFTGKCESRTELIFVIDRSGSMEGSNMNYAKDALLLFLKSIPNKCRFQIIGFGSNCKSLFPEPVDYTEASLSKALEYQTSMKADMGGTEVYGALKTAIDTPLTGKGWYREIIFLTDGDVMNPSQVIGLVRSNVSKARLFAVGIGQGASTHLVSGVARAGRGTSVFLLDGSQLQSTVSKLLNTALEPRANDVQVEVKVERKLANGKMEPVEAVVVPKQAPPILSGCFNTTYALLKTESMEGISGTATVKFELGGQDQTVSLDLSRHLQSGCVVESGDQELHRLAGKCQISELTEEYNALKCLEDKGGKKVDDDAKRSKLRDEVVQLSCQLNILSIFTALVGVDPKKQDIKTIVLKPVPPYKPRDYVDGACRARGSGMVLHHKSAAVPMDVEYYAGNFSAPDERKQHDAFTEMVSLQAFNGSWKLDKPLAKQVGVTLKKLEESTPKEWSVSLRVSVAHDVWATSLAIAFFELAFFHRRADWKLIISKALDWLTEQCEKSGAARQDSEQLCKILIQTAEEFLRHNSMKPA